jgi:protein-serine/threonine kinase
MTYTGHFVYPDDAEEIKNHPFFQGIQWETLHLRTPPWVPGVEDDDMAAYFQPEEELKSNPESDDSDSISAKDRSSVDKAETPARVLDSPFARLLAKKGWMDEMKKADETPEASKKRHLRDKRRPRDRVLRDARVGKTVMELRKRVGFLGYTYRRPTAWVPGYEIERSHTKRKPLPNFT